MHCHQLLPTHLLRIIQCAIMMFVPHSVAQLHDCSNTITVNSSTTLQQAINSVTSSDHIRGQVSNCVRIEIPSGEHVLTSQTLFPAEVGGIEIIGLEDGVYVSCDYHVMSNYTWYFAGLPSVMLWRIKFEGCPRPLRLDTVAEVDIHNCSFRYFTEAALDVYNCHHTTFNNSLLEHNVGTGIVNASYRGNTGGVSFGYNTLPLNFSSPTLSVSNCTFRNNNATATAGFLTSSQAFFAQIFTGRGGSMAVFTNESRYDLQVSITDCIYESSFARSFGGGIYLLLGGFGTRHRIVMERARVTSNIAELGGGGVQASFFNNGLEDDPLLMVFIDCEFIRNTGIAGGGLFVFTSTDGGVGNQVEMQGCTFTGNRGYQGGPRDYGAAVALSLLNPLVERTNFPRHLVSNCTFHNNSGANGIVSVGYSPMNFTGENLFIQNNGTALRVVGALIYLSGRLQFINNTASASEESALYMLSFAQAVLSRGLQLNFKGNTGRFGASISIESITTSAVYTQLPFNPQCPFLHEDMDTAPLNWTDVTVRFADNTAILGSTIYVSRLTACSWYSRRPPFFNNTIITNWPIWQFESSNEDTGYTAEEQMNSTLSVQTRANRLVISNNTVRAWPGLRLTLGISGWDEFSHTTTTTAGFSFHPFNNSPGIPEIRFLPEVVVVGPDSTTGLLTRYFTVYYGIGGDSPSGTRGRGELDGVVGTVTVQDPIETLPVESANFTLETLICPAGYVLRPHTTQTGIRVCTCNEEIADLLLCEDDQETVVIRRGKWAVFVRSDPETNLHFYPCPMGYCRCHHENSISNVTCVYLYSHTDPDSQCACSRRGTLCGECRDEGEGVSALLNECVTCSNTSGLLILALIIADAVVFLVLMFVDKPLHSWLYPFIFYIQLAPVIGLDFPDSFNEIGKYLYFIGSASGFYFIYDFCLYDNMSSQVAYFIRYLPLFMGILMCSPVVISRSFIYRKYLKRKSLHHHGLWLILLLSYSHIVYTSMTILNCPSITDTNGDTSPRWYVNGEVECFTGGHIALGMLAILVLLAALLLIPCIILVATGRLKAYGLELFRHPLVLVYRDECQWWGGVELGRRFLLLLFTVSLPQNEVVKIFVVVVYTTVYSYTQPYRSHIANLLETAINLNFLFMLVVNATSFFHDDFFIFSSFTTTSSSHCSSFSGIALVSWVLMPIYYLPVIGACITTLVLAILFIRERSLSASNKPALEDSGVYTSVTGTGPLETWTIQLPDNVSESTEGYLNVNRRSKQFKQGKTSVLYNKSSFFGKKSNPNTVITNT